MYTSIEELADSADTVLIGTVGEIQETSNEGGGTVMAYTSIDVREWLRKPDRLNDEDGAVIVSVPDVTSQSEDELAAFHLEQGQIVAIFGSYISPDDAPIAIPESGLISPLSLEGILDIEEDTATARSSLLLAKTEAEASEIEDEMEPSLAPDGSEITTSDARAAQQMSISFDLESVRVLVVG